MTYEVQCADSLNNAAWQTLASVVCTTSPVKVSNSAGLAGQRFYRAQSRQSLELLRWTWGDGLPRPALSGKFRTSPRAFSGLPLQTLDGKLPLHPRIRHWDKGLLPACPAFGLSGCITR